MSLAPRRATRGARKLASIMRNIAIPYGGPVPSGLLAAIATGQPPADVPPFVRSWDRDFDYLYMLGAPAANPLPDRLEVLETSERFVLYRIRRKP